MPDIKAILFDLDGTLTDSALDLSIAVNSMLGKLDLPEQPVETIYGYIGRGVRNLLKQALGPSREKDLDEALALFRAYYWDHCLDNTVLYPGVARTLDALKDYPLAVVTNKTRRFAVKILESLGVASRFCVILGGDDYPALKPDPSPVVMACGLLDVSPRASLMVGDSISDTLSARSAGALCCGVTYGLGKPGELLENGATWLIDAMPELPPLVEEIIKHRDTETQRKRKN